MPITKYFCRIKPEEMPPKDNTQPPPDPKKTAGGKEEEPEEKEKDPQCKGEAPSAENSSQQGVEDMDHTGQGEALVGRESGHAK